ncbi:MAG: hypothetical protein QOG85_1943 [Gaiellaceae bacterium]|jgi:hypothetical protein|nr:hypothetical protein [Gaiellaceae bacterium]
MAEQLGQALLADDLSGSDAFGSAPSGKGRLMYPPTSGNDLLAAAVEACRSCREHCETHLGDLRPESRPRDLPQLAGILRCVALLSVISDNLRAAGACPIDLIDATVEIARDLPDDPLGCAAACRRAADALSEWLNASYEH